ncbi:MAG TPA: nucleotidyltransferase family protein [Anaerolineales bacterium]|nr:nucleotidyltransferase family protein [Anaerolineales bacterium]
MGILETDRLKLAELCRSNGISRLALFGSAARGEATSGSDIDLIADLPDGATLLDMVRLEREFSSVLGKSVDLLTEESISPYIRERIKDDILVVYEAN